MCPSCGLRPVTKPSWALVSLPGWGELSSSPSSLSTVSRTHESPSVMHGATFSNGWLLLLLLSWGPFFRDLLELFIAREVSGCSWEKEFLVWGWGHHQLTPAQEEKRDSFNQRLSWLKEASSFSDDPKTTPKLSLEQPALGYFDVGPGMMWWASLCQASASDRGTLPYEETHAPWILASWSMRPQDVTFFCGADSVSYKPPGPDEGLGLSSVCGLSLSSSPSRSTLWSCSYFLDGIMSINIQHSFNPISTFCCSSHESPSSIQKQPNITWFIHKQGTRSSRWVMWSIIFASPHHISGVRDVMTTNLRRQALLVWGPLRNNIRRKRSVAGNLSRSCKFLVEEWGRGPGKGRWLSERISGSLPSF